MNDNKGIDLQQWAIDNEPSKEMYFYDGYWHQIMLVRDQFTSLVFGSRMEGEGNRTVIGTHLSKSILLPVYQMVVEELGLTLVLRCNFHDWKVSVISEMPIICDFMKLFNPNDKWSTHYCEGFRSEHILPSYTESNTGFTVELANDFTLHTFLWVLMHHLRANYTKWMEEVQCKK